MNRKTKMAYTMIFIIIFYWVAFRGDGLLNMCVAESSTILLFIAIELASINDRLNKK